MGAVGPIPFTAMLVWLDEHEIHDKDERSDMIYLIGEMDTEYLRYANARDEDGDDG